MFRPVTSVLRRFEAWLHAPAPAERLAALRIAIGGFVTLYLITDVREFARLADQDQRAFEPIGVAGLLDTPLDPVAIWLLFAALVITGSAFTLGARVRVSAPIFAFLVLCWTSYHSSWGQLLHFEHLFTIHLLILALAPTADAWALRSPTIAVSPLPEPSDRYGWPIRLLALATATTYVLSGIAKLRLSGFAWFDADTLAAHIGYSATRLESIGAQAPPLARPILERQWLLPVMAAGALAVEFGAPLAFFGRKLRNLWVVIALLFHAGAAATMLVFFGYRGLGFAMLPLFHLERLPSYLAHRVGKLRARPTRALRS